MSVLLGRNREADAEYGLVDTAGEGEGKIFFFLMILFKGHSKMNHSSHCPGICPGIAETFLDIFWHLC